MQRKILTLLFLFFLLFILFCQFQCSTGQAPPASKEQLPVYLNHLDSVKYVGMETCRSCHGSIYESFIQTGMGQSFHQATRAKSAADFTKNHVVYDKELNYYYKAFFSGNDMMMMEFRLQGKDTIHKRIEKVAYIIGSGQHTNSHIMQVNGYLYQMPMTWYAQQGKWDLPPGFENGRNSRFTRIIGEECMSCHNALPAYVKGSENKFTTIPQGIDCERCHGPGEVHVKEKLAGIKVDTTGNHFDPTIVNPRHLSWERQIDVCQRCHLQGNSILKPGKTFRDFRPGMKLSDFWEVYMPRYAGADEEFIMASHADRLQQSQCFVQSNKGKAAGELAFTCISCHNPHVSVKVTGKQVFNQACLNCHNTETKSCIVSESKRVSQNGNNCVACHMPRSGTIDIPHVTVHDHYIRKPLTENKTAAIKKYIGLACINNPKAGKESKAKAFVSYYERFEGDLFSLDSAQRLISGAPITEQFITQVQVMYLKNKPQDVADLANNYSPKQIQDAWTNYRIGQCYLNLAQNEKAENWFRQAVVLAPANLSFQNKLGEALIQQKKLDEAITLLQELVLIQPNYIQSINNIGFAFLLKGEVAEANRWYDRALKIDPDYEPALLNKAGLYNALGEKERAKSIIQQLLKKKPNDLKLKEILAGIR